MDRQMFRQGGIVPMQEGGIAGMMAAPGMAGAMAAQSDMPTEAVGQAAGAIDPSMLEGMLAEVAGNIENMDAAEDFESVMNAMRGDNATIEERRDELAGVVGPEDAAQTPESVLALVQPVMQLASIDQGIGGLAADRRASALRAAADRSRCAAASARAAHPVERRGPAAPTAAANCQKPRQTAPMPPAPPPAASAQLLHAAITQPVAALHAAISHLQQQGATTALRLPVH